MITIPKASLLQIRSKSLAVDSFYGTNGRFAVNGPIDVRYLGFLITTAFPAGANTLKFRFTPAGGSLTDLSGATDTASAAAMQLFLVDGTKGTALIKTTAVGILAAGQALNMPIVISDGVISMTFSASAAPASGVGKVFIAYYPLSAKSAVTVKI